MGNYRMGNALNLESREEKVDRRREVILIGLVLVIWVKSLHAVYVHKEELVNGNFVQILKLRRRNTFAGSIDLLIAPKLGPKRRSALRSGPPE